MSLVRYLFAILFALMSYVYIVYVLLIHFNMGYLNINN